MNKKDLKLVTIKLNSDDVEKLETLKFLYDVNTSQLIREFIRTAYVVEMEEVNK